MIILGRLIITLPLRLVNTFVIVPRSKFSEELRICVWESSTALSHYNLEKLMDSMLYFPYQYSDLIINDGVGKDILKTLQAQNVFISSEITVVVNTDASMVVADYDDGNWLLTEYSENENFRWEKGTYIITPFFP